MWAVDDLMVETPGGRHAHGADVRRVIIAVLRELTARKSTEGHVDGEARYLARSRRRSLHHWACRRSSGGQAASDGTNRNHSGFDPEGLSQSRNAWYAYHQSCSHLFKEGLADHVVRVDCSKSSSCSGLFMVLIWCRHHRNLFCRWTLSCEVRSQLLRA